MIAHWDEADAEHDAFGHIEARWTGLGYDAGSRGVGLNRIEIAPGKWSTPFHRHTEEEEIFYVLGGNGVCLTDGGAFAVRPGDCIVHRARETHTLRANEGGLDVLVFANRKRSDAAHLPRVGISWLSGAWVEAGRGAHPYEREAALGEPDLPEPGERPASVVNADEVEGDFGGAWKLLGQAAGSVQSGLNLGRLEEGDEGAPPHCHSAEEELFVILEGEGTLELWPSPQSARRGAEREEHPLRPGHVVARPPGTRIAHLLRGGPAGMTYLAYGTRVADDTCLYPRSNKIFFRGLGVIARLEDLDYSDGEPS